MSNAAEQPESQVSRPFGSFAAAAMMLKQLELNICTSLGVKQPKVSAGPGAGAVAAKKDTSTSARLRLSQLSALHLLSALTTMHCAEQLLSNRTALTGGRCTRWRDPDALRTAKWEPSHLLCDSISSNPDYHLEQACSASLTRHKRCRRRGTVVQMSR